MSFRLNHIEEKDSREQYPKRVYACIWIVLQAIYQGEARIVMQKHMILLYIEIIIKLNKMQPKITFTNQQSYSDTKKLYLNNNQNSSSLINFSNPITTTTLDYKSNLDQNFNKVQNVNQI